MYRIDNPDAVTAIPAPSPLGNPGYFTGGNPQSGQAATIVDADWLNAVQEEISTVIERFGLTLSKTDRTQLWQALTGMQRQLLTGPLSMYVNAATGLDTNDGLSAATPMQTLNAAWGKIMHNYDLGGNLITVHMADGTYAPLYAAGQPTGLQGAGAPPVLFQGNVANPQNVIVSATAAQTHAVEVVNGAYIAVDSFTVQSSGVGGAGLFTAIGGIIQIRSMRFGNCALAHIDANAGAGFMAVTLGAQLTIAGNAQICLCADGGGVLEMQGANFVLVGTPNFSAGFAAAERTGYIIMYTNTFSGAATGPHYAVNLNGVIDTQGGGPTYFPGNAAGVQNTGGQYN